MQNNTEDDLLLKATLIRSEMKRVQINPISCWRDFLLSFKECADKVPQVRNLVISGRGLSTLYEVPVSYCRLPWFCQAPGNQGREWTARGLLTNTGPLQGGLVFKR